MRLLFFSFAILLVSCDDKPLNNPEPWINQPVSEWPTFAMTNEVAFSDTTFSELANGFLVNTGSDTVAVSCKHWFMIFEKYIGLSSIELGENFLSWKMFPKGNKEYTVTLDRLINHNPNEPIGQFNSLKVRDWIIFEIDQSHEQIYPLKIRRSPIKTNEIVYAVGWGLNDKPSELPQIVKLQCIKALKEYTFTKTLSKDIAPEGRSGSPVIDKNGYLVGIVSGQEGNMGVIGNTSYLLEQFDNYGISYIP